MTQTGEYLDDVVGDGGFGDALLTAELEGDLLQWAKPADDLQGPLDEELGGSAHRDQAAPVEGPGLGAVIPHCDLGLTQG